MNSCVSWVLALKIWRTYSWKEIVVKMREIMLIKLGEIVLKGLNRKNFEDKLIKNIRQKISSVGNFELRNMQSTIYLIPADENADFEGIQYIQHLLIMFDDKLFFSKLSHIQLPPWHSVSQNDFFRNWFRIDRIIWSN